MNYLNRLGVSCLSPPLECKLCGSRTLPASFTATPSVPSTVLHGDGVGTYLLHKWTGESPMWKTNSVPAGRVGLPPCGGDWRSPTHRGCENHTLPQCFQGVRKELESRWLVALTLHPGSQTLMYLNHLGAYQNADSDSAGIASA